MTASGDEQGSILCEVPSNPIPDGARAGYFLTSDKVRLRYALWSKSAGAPKGTICVVQGRTEFIEKYFETIEDFRKRGFGVATFDLRGQGGSDRLINHKHHGYVDSIDDYVTDLKSFHSQILLPDCTPPFYLVGHSTGGLVSLLAVAEDRMMFDRVFLSSPMLGLPGLPFSAPVMASIMEGLCFVGAGQAPLARRQDEAPTEKSFAGNALTSDFGRFMQTVHVLQARPDLMVTSPTIRWIASALRGITHASEDHFPGSVRVPVFMLAAARDSVVNPAAIEHLGVRMRTGRHAMIPGARHELFVENDDIRAQVFAAFDAFITEQTPI